MLLSIINKSIREATDIVQKGKEDAIWRVEETLWDARQQIIDHKGYNVPAPFRKRKEKLANLFWDSNKIYQIRRQAAEASMKHILKTAVYFYSILEPIGIHIELDRARMLAIRY